MVARWKQRSVFNSPLTADAGMADQLLPSGKNGKNCSRVVTAQITSFKINQFYVLPTQCIYVFCVDLRTNSHYFPIQH